jgi:hypothetical protein
MHPLNLKVMTWSWSLFGGDLRSMRWSRTMDHARNPLDESPREGTSSGTASDPGAAT